MWAASRLIVIPHVLWYLRKKKREEFGLMRALNETVHSYGVDSYQYVGNSLKKPLAAAAASVPVQYLSSTQVAEEINKGCKTITHLLTSYKLLTITNLLQTYLSCFVKV